MNHKYPPPFFDCLKNKDTHKMATNPGADSTLEAINLHFIQTKINPIPFRSMVKQQQTRQKTDREKVEETHSTSSADHPLSLGMQ